jgi:hypothetical protein
MSDSKWTLVPINQLKEPSETAQFFQVYTDCWWVVTRGTNQAIFYRNRSPLCNADRTIAEHLAANLTRPEAQDELRLPALTTVFVHRVFIPIRLDASAENSLDLSPPLEQT